MPAPAPGAGPVAVIGAGPAGLAVSRCLLEAGFDPIIFEQADQPGGQWHTRNPASGIWPGMRTNTSREMTRFSELDYSPGIDMFPSSEEVHRYLLDYAAEFELLNRIHLQQCVVALRQNGAQWELELKSPGKPSTRRTHDRVVVATGRFGKPVFPEVPGLDPIVTASSETRPEILHARDYAGPRPFQGKRVVVAGGAISALEIASELAASGARQVIVSSRRQRYVLRKHFRGIPTDHLNYCLAEALAAEALSAEEVAAELREFILRTAGCPSQHGAPKPANDIRQAGVTKCEPFLDEVSAGRIQCRPWLRRVSDGGQVQFTDGSHADCDVLICATGYGAGLPFLDQSIREALALDDQFIGLYRHTFHPDLPGLAMAGFIDQSGPYLPVIELQARWIAGVFSGSLPAPPADALRAELAELLAGRDQPQKYLMHRVAVAFAREIGVLPDPEDWPGLARHLLFGPLSPGVFRLQGPGALPEAPAMVKRAARAFGMIQNEEYTQAERARMHRLGIGIEQEHATP